MSAQIPMVWTEIGRMPGAYVVNAITIHKELFPDIPRYLVVSKEFAAKISDDLCAVVIEEDLLGSENAKEFEVLQKNWSYKHVSYWQNTTRRFFVLENFMDSLNFEKIIHLESDCILLEVNYLFKLFIQGSWGLKYTMQDDLSACASIFLVNQKSNLSDLNKFILEKWLAADITDMKLLHDFKLNNLQATYLPSGSANIEEIVFDAGTIGRYYLGGDSRNNLIPFSTRGLLPQGSGFFDPTPYRIKINQKKVILESIDDSSKSLLLGCVHVHSKKIPRSSRKFFKMLVRESGGSRGKLWQIGRLDFTVLAERVVSKLFRVINSKSPDKRYR